MPSKILIAIRALLLISALAAAWLLVGTLTASGVAGCGPESGCGAVLKSRWAHLLGVPVSAPALLIYIAALVVTFFSGGSRAAEGNEPPGSTATIRLAAVALGGLIVGAAVWFTGLQVFVLKQICPFCLTAHICGLFGGVGLICMALRKSGDGSASTGKRLLPGAGVAVLGLAIMVVAQVVAPPPKGHRSGVVEPGGASGGSARETVSADGKVVLHDGKFTLDPGALPIIGDPGARHIIVCLFDSTCEHCRELHPMLEPLVERYRGQLSVITLPMPLDAGCNPVITSTSPFHKNACDYARLAYAVWRADREAYPTFVKWLTAPDSPPARRPDDGLEQVRAKADTLAGKPAMEAALADPWVAEQLAMAVALYEANARKIKDSGMPQLNIGPAVSVGAIYDASEIDLMLDLYLEMQIP